MKIHTVIKHLLARKHKKVPIKDGRKIALVLFGGAMTGIRGAGSMIALKELGLDNAFDEIYCSSAGFCNASYLLSGNPEEGTSLYYEELSGHKFINLRKVWDLADVDYVIRCVKKAKPLNVKNILAHPTKLFVQVDNLIKKEIEFYEVHQHSPSRYFSLLKAAIKMPFLSPGTVRIGRGRFKDIIWDADWLPLIKKVFQSKATDILIIYNYQNQHTYVHEHINFSKFKGNIYEICPKSDAGLNRTETNPAKLKKACMKMGNVVKKIFGSKRPISLKYTSIFL